MEDWAEIRRLHLAEEIPMKEIARRLGLARNTVREAVRSSVPPKYDRPAAGWAGRLPRAGRHLSMDAQDWADWAVATITEQVFGHAEPTEEIEIERLSEVSRHRNRVSGPTTSH